MRGPSDISPGLLMKLSWVAVWAVRRIQRLHERKHEPNERARTWTSVLGVETFFMLSTLVLEEQQRLKTITEGHGSHFIQITVSYHAGKQQL